MPRIIAMGNLCYETKSKEINGRHDNAANVLASFEIYKDTKTGEIKKTKTQFLTLKAWGEQAEKLKTISKGSLVKINGRLIVKQSIREGAKYNYMYVQAQHIDILKEKK